MRMVFFRFMMNIPNFFSQNHRNRFLRHSQGRIQLFVPEKKDRAEKENRSKKKKSCKIYPAALNFPGHSRKFRKII